MSLYETLDLETEPRPTGAQIKRAYRRKAKETHPDVGGSREEFAKVSRAYLVLSNPVRRAKYDATGEIPEQTPESAPLNLLVQFFVTMVQMFCNGAGPDPCTMDLVKVAREQFRKDILQMENEQVKVRAAIKKWEDVAMRFSNYNKKVDVIHLSLRGQIPPLEAQLRLMDEQIGIRKDAMKLLDGYTFAFEQPQPQAQTWVNVFR